ncbi:putative HhH-GPD base excision DNA repair family protein [Hibiscus syriacus]|uniref:HhH-GPD base excision DNA repair family protein n=1 Tax=Hibiscus syriacus TaxID=106335 RepID=A0A6A2YTM6_HIBSY|nr:putative HhH-GPD base excision DNA repair family protein [Hibiscus syriacus]
MASLYCNNRGRDSCFTNARYGRSRSKAQACLEKILHLISTVPPPSENDTEPFKKRGFDIDLNLRLGTATATDASSDVTDIQKSEEFKSGTGGDVKTAAAFNGSLDLLIEAALGPRPFTSTSPLPSPLFVVLSLAINMVVLCHESHGCHDFSNCGVHEDSSSSGGYNHLVVGWSFNWVGF